MKGLETAVGYPELKLQKRARLMTKLAGGCEVT